MHLLRFPYVNRGRSGDLVFRSGRAGTHTPHYTWCLHGSINSNFYGKLIFCRYTCVRGQKLALLWKYRGGGGWPSVVPCKCAADGVGYCSNSSTHTAHCTSCPLRNTHSTSSDSRSSSTCIQAPVAGVEIGSAPKPYATPTPMQLDAIDRSVVSQRGPENVLRSFHSAIARPQL